MIQLVKYPANVLAIFFAKVVKAVLEKKSALGVEFNVVDLLAKTFQRFIEITAGSFHLFLNPLFGLINSFLKVKLEPRLDTTQPPTTGEDAGRCAEHRPNNSCGGMRPFQSSHSPTPRCLRSETGREPG